MRIYIYDHCPFCNRVRIANNLLNMQIEEICLANDDVQTPTELIGKKLLPILQKDDQTAMGESMDIVNYLNAKAKNELKLDEVGDKFIDDWMENFQPVALRLVFPITAQIPFAEFATQSARDSYINAKTAKFGDLAKLGEQKPEFLAKTQNLFAKLETYFADNAYLEKFSQNKFSLSDINLYAFLRMLTIVKGVEYPSKVGEFMQIMQEKSKLESLEKFEI